MRQWADFSSALGHGRNCTRRGNMACGLSEAEASHLASTYEIVSIEKCFGTGGENRTMANFAATAAQLKSHNPNVSVLFYWNARTPGPPSCYEDDFGARLLTRRDWWLRDAFGRALCVDHGGGLPIPVCADDDMTWPYLDFSIREAADWWVSAPVAAKRMSGENMSGAFFDSCDRYDWTLVSNVSAAHAAAWSAGQRAAASPAWPTSV